MMRYRPPSIVSATRVECADWQHLELGSGAAEAPPGDIAEGGRASQLDGGLFGSPKDGVYTTITSDSTCLVKREKQ